MMGRAEMSSFARSRIAYLLGLLALVIIGLVTAPPASAWNRLHCQYNSSTIKFYVDENDSPNTDFGSAGNQWESGTPVTFTQVTDPANRDIRVRNHDFGALGWSGLTHKDGDFGQGPRCNSNGYWVNQDVAIAVNTHYNNNGPDRRRGVAIHEFGHALGLDHNTTLLGQCPSGGGKIYQAIMYPNDDRFSGGCPIFTPTSDDKNGVNALY